MRTSNIFMSNSRHSPTIVQTAIWKTSPATWPLAGTKYSFSNYNVYSDKQGHYKTSNQKHSNDSMQKVHMKPSTKNNFPGYLLGSQRIEMRV